MISDYLFSLLGYFIDIRVKKNIIELGSSIVTSGHLRLYSMSSDKKEYDVFKGLLNGHQVNTLTADYTLEAIRDEAIARLGSTSHVYALHDGSDIRKAHAKDMEYLGKVLSLNKQVISGYKTMNSVAVNISGKDLNLLEHFTYSTHLPNFITEERLNALAADPTIDPDLCEQIKKGAYINNKTAYFQTVQNSHNTLKRANLDVLITHIQDREYDGEEYFEFVDDLGDELISRLKLSRSSNELIPTWTPKGKPSVKKVYKKLIDKDFDNQFSYDIARISLKNKTYTNVKCALEWETLDVNERTYSVIRITLKDEKGKPLFQHPMMLITNRPILCADDAKKVYQAYLLRFKIEVVFRFLKHNLGWETFQVRDFQTIKNLLAFTFFLVGYFKELEKHIQNHEIYHLIAQIGGAKGIVSVHFLLKGIEKLVHFQQVQELIDNNVLTKNDIDEALKKFNHK